MVYKRDLRRLCHLDVILYFLIRETVMRVRVSRAPHDCEECVDKWVAFPFQ